MPRVTLLVDCNRKRWDSNQRPEKVKRSRGVHRTPHVCFSDRVHNETQPSSTTCNDDRVGTQLERKKSVGSMKGTSTPADK